MLPPSLVAARGGIRFRLGHPANCFCANGAFRERRGSRSQGWALAHPQGLALTEVFDAHNARTWRKNVGWCGGECRAARRRPRGRAEGNQMEREGGGRLRLFRQQVRETVESRG